MKWHMMWALLCHGASSATGLWMTAEILRRPSAGRFCLSAPEYRDTREVNCRERGPAPGEKIRDQCGRRRRPAAAAGTGDAGGRPQRRPGLCDPLPLFRHAGRPGFPGQGGRTGAAAEAPPADLQPPVRCLEGILRGIRH